MTDMKRLDLKKILPALLLVTMLAAVCFLPESAQAASYGGSFGKGLKWNLSSKGTLTISGKGAIPNCTNGSPWESRNDKIKKIVIKSGITGIGSEAFQNCYATQVQIPSSVSTIGYAAFLGSNLRSVYLPNSVKQMGSFCFQGCLYLKQVRLSPNCPVISKFAFCSCDSLSSVTVPEGVVIIDESAFEFGKSLSAVQLPSTLTKIGKKAFNKSNNGYRVSQVKIGTVKLPKGLKYIGSLAFEACGLSDNIVIPDTVEFLGRDAFQDTKMEGKLMVESQEYPGMIIVGTTLMNYRYTSENAKDEGVVEVPEGITAISNYAFQGLMPLQEGGSSKADLPRDHTTVKVKLPSSVKYIGEEAFFGADVLEEINLENVQVIEDGAFNECTSLEMAELSPQIRSMGASVFRDCTSLEYVNTGGLKVIPAWTFSGDNALFVADYAGPMDFIGQGAFENCSSLYCFPKLSNKVTSIPDSAFFNCVDLTNFTIPSSVKSIGSGAFAYDKGLSSVVTLPPWVKYIGSRAFHSSGVKTIRGVYGSVAWKYAVQDRLKFVQMGTKKQTIRTSVKTKKVKYTKLKKKARTVKPITIKAAKGTVRYKIVSGKKKARRALKINAKTGKIKLKRKTPRGTYTVKVRIVAYGTTVYRSATKDVKVKVRVR